VVMVVVVVAMDSTASTTAPMTCCKNQKDSRELHTLMKKKEI